MRTGEEKGVKEMQNREELRQKGHDRRRKRTCRQRGKKYHFQRGGGINIVFRPKYRPLVSDIPLFRALLIHDVLSDPSSELGWLFFYIRLGGPVPDPQ